MSASPYDYPAGAGKQCPRCDEFIDPAQEHKCSVREAAKCKHCPAILVGHEVKYGICSRVSCLDFEYDSGPDMREAQFEMAMNRR